MKIGGYASEKREHAKKLSICRPVCDSFNDGVKLLDKRRKWDFQPLHVIQPFRKSCWSLVSVEFGLKRVYTVRSF